LFKSSLVVKRHEAQRLDIRELLPLVDGFCDKSDVRRRQATCAPDRAKAAFGLQVVVAATRVLAKLPAAARDCEVLLDPIRPAGQE
jgi:hypothetical protein